MHDESLSSDEMNERAPEKPVTLEQRPDVEDDEVIPEEETQLRSLPDYVYVPKEEPFEGSSLKGENMSFISVCNCVSRYVFQFFSPLKVGVTFLSSPLF